MKKAAIAASVSYRLLCPALKIGAVIGKVRGRSACACRTGLAQCYKS